MQLNPEFVACTNEAAFRDQARRILVATYFEPAERNALYHLLGMAVPTDDEIARDANFERPDDARLTGREARFRLDVVPTYNYTCALTGYRVTTIGQGTIVDAAHIHEFSDSRNNDPRTAWRCARTPTGCSTLGCGPLAMITELLWPIMHSPKIAPIRGRLRITTATRCVCRKTNRCGPTQGTSRGTASTRFSEPLDQARPRFLN